MTNVSRSGGERKRILKRIFIDSVYRPVIHERNQVEFEKRFHEEQTKRMQNVQFINFITYALYGHIM